VVGKIGVIGVKHKSLRQPLFRARKARRDALKRAFDALECLSLLDSARQTAGYDPTAFGRRQSQTAPCFGAGLEATGLIQIADQTGAGEAALQNGAGEPSRRGLMDVQLDGAWNGIEAAIALRREYPRLPVVFYSIQDDDAYYRAFGFGNSVALRLRAKIEFLAAVDDRSALARCRRGPQFHRPGHRIQSAGSAAKRRIFAVSLWSQTRAKSPKCWQAA
jgi:hypothetical protein